ncbi:hypothetical protein CMV_023521 [Castanea mollissima]|uniref:RING-type domain-containing protein n=1 Tax=Castanea mollissima TaxID=60419 RepID=A0A8J4QHE8_9ROSI|nr:hypothetical protein CMV_023521 [Castanea mollissima]
MIGGTSIGKTICSICYEDLKPLVEDLQAISICGHVFHELCLQQWFEYCSSAKKCSCPVCKQSCSASNVNRLYFQSVGDSNDLILSQNVEDEDPRELRGQVQRLEVKVKGLSSLLERQGKELKDVNDQVNSIAFLDTSNIGVISGIEEIRVGISLFYFIFLLILFGCD